MHTSLEIWQKKIQDKRKQTPFRDFVMEVASWYSMMFYRDGTEISRYSKTAQTGPRITTEEFAKIRDSIGLFQVEYDPSMSFFQQFDTLYKKTPTPYLTSDSASTNAQFADSVYGSSNIYLSFMITDCENVCYSFQVKSGTNIIDSVGVYTNSENIYRSAGSIKSYEIFYSQFVTDCRQIWFSSNLIGCEECIFCTDLSNQSYCINNTPYEQEEYFQKKAQILSQKHQFDEWFRALKTTFSKNPRIVNSENIENGDFVFSVKNARNILFLSWKVDKHDIYDAVWGGTIGNFYGSLGCWADAEHIYCTIQSSKSSYMFYCMFSTGCHHCLGCIGLQNKSYSIFNKQYTPEEWITTAHQILANMDEEGVLGNFFPPALNPFPFNDTLADLLGDFTQEEITTKWYKWRTEDITVDIPENTATLHVWELPEQYDTSICSKVLIDANWKAYKIVPLEYEFLEKYSLPLPKEHWFDRMKQNLHSPLFWE